MGKPGVPIWILAIQHAIELPKRILLEFPDDPVAGFMASIAKMSRDFTRLIRAPSEPSGGHSRSHVETCLKRMFETTFRSTLRSGGIKFSGEILPGM